MRCKLQPGLVAEAQHDPKCRLKSSHHPSQSRHDPKCRLKSSHHPSQSSSTNYCIILGQRDKAALPTSQQIIIIMEICIAPTLQLKALNKPSITHIMEWCVILCLFDAIENVWIIIVIIINSVRSEWSIDTRKVSQRSDFNSGSTTGLFHRGWPQSSSGSSCCYQCLFASFHATCH